MQRAPQIPVVGKSQEMRLSLTHQGPKHQKFESKLDSGSCKGRSWLPIFRKYYLQYHVKITARKPNHKASQVKFLTLHVSATPNISLGNMHRIKHVFYHKRSRRSSSLVAFGRPTSAAKSFLVISITGAFNSYSHVCTSAAQ